MRRSRRVAVLTAGASALLVFLAPAAMAQIPPLPPPPVPPQALPVLEIVSPVAHPACGNAILATTIVVAVAPAELREPLELATSNTYVVCGSIPPPVGERTQCEIDQTVQELGNQILGAAIGAPLFVPPPKVGQVFDSLIALEDRLPAPLNDVGAAAVLAPILTCVAAAAPAPPVAPSPPGETTTPPEFPGPGFAPPPGFVPDVPSFAAAAPPPSPPLERSLRPAALKAISHPIFVVPLLVIAMATVFGRGLLAFEQPSSPRQGRRRALVLRHEDSAKTGL